MTIAAIKMARSPAWVPHAEFSRERHRRALADLRQPRPVAWIAANLLTWLVIAAAITAAEQVPWLLPIAWLVIASRQHALGVLMHDGAHGTIHQAPNTNLLLANAMAAWPLGVTTEGFRSSHLAHHAHTQTEQDPDFARKLAHDPEDWQVPMPRRRLLALLARDVFGRGLWHMLRRTRWYGAFASARAGRTLPTCTRWRLGRLAWLATVAAILTGAGTWSQFALYWLVPMFCLLPALLRMRSLGEHFALPHHDDLTSTRDVDAPWLERQFFGPFGICWHLTHHLFPDIPSVNMHRAHRRLRRDPGYDAFGTRSSSYLGVRDSVLAAITTRDQHDDHW